MKTKLKYVKLREIFPRLDGELATQIVGLEYTKGAWYIHANINVCNEVFKLLPHAYKQYEVLIKWAI